jgi:hypothetical protein
MAPRARGNDVRIVARQHGDERADRDVNGDLADAPIMALGQGLECPLSDSNRGPAD